jgi:hypothetical protein
MSTKASGEAVLLLPAADLAPARYSRLIQTGMDRDCQDKEKAMHYSACNAFVFYPDYPVHT